MQWPRMLKLCMKCMKPANEEYHSVHATADQHVTFTNAKYMFGSSTT